MLRYTLPTVVDCSWCSIVLESVYIDVLQYGPSPIHQEYLVFGSLQ